MKSNAARVTTGKKKVVDQVKAYLFSSIRVGMTLPKEWDDYRLCRLFGWTPDQLDEIDDQTLRLYRRFIEIEGETGMMSPSSSSHG